MEIAAQSVARNLTSLRSELDNFLVDLVSKDLVAPAMVQHGEASELARQPELETTVMSSLATSSSSHCFTEGSWDYLTPNRSVAL